MDKKRIWRRKTILWRFDLDFAAFSKSEVYIWFHLDKCVSVSGFWWVNWRPSFAHAVWALAIFDGRHICIATVAIGRQERTIKFNESGKNLSIGTPLWNPTLTLVSLVKVVCCLNNHLELNLSSLMPTYSKLKYWKAQIYWKMILNKYPKNTYKLTTNDYMIWLWYHMIAEHATRLACSSSVNIIGLDVNLMSLCCLPRPALKWNVVETSCQTMLANSGKSASLKLPGSSAESEGCNWWKQSSFHLLRLVTNVGSEGRREEQQPPKIRHLRQRLRSVWPWVQLVHNWTNCINFEDAAPYLAAECWGYEWSKWYLRI